MRIFFTLLSIIVFGQLAEAQVPAISSFSPAAGPVGTTITITGTNFNTTPANNIVFFGVVRAVVLTASTNMLTVKVPAGATYQPITITNNGLTAFSAMPFVVTFPGGGQAFASSSFASKIDYAAGLGTDCIAAGDLDGDGKPDLVSANAVSNTLSVFRNLCTTGSISFAPKTDYNTGSKPYSVAVGDVDGDGRPDIVTANGGSNTVSIFRNTSSGAGNISFSPKIDLPTGPVPFCVIIMDLDKDGKPDMAVANSSSNTISVFKNNSIPGSVSFSLKSDFASGASPFWIAAGDLDNDGKPELVSANGIFSNTVSVLKNTSTQGNISFALKTDFDGGNFLYSIAIGDIDGDGKADLVVSGESNTSGAILLNRSTGVGDISFAQKLSISAGNSSFGVSLSDMDGDGKTDIVIANSNTSTISVVKNKSVTGFLSFDPKRDFVTGTNPWVSALTDLDGDGRPDIATANYASANISVLRNTVLGSGIDNFTPVSAATGTTIAISGVNFVGVTGVSFGGVPATSFTVLSATSITAVVGAGASGKVTIATIDTNFSLPGFTYLPSPVINSFSTSTAGSGDTIIITGTNFTGTTSVSFGGIPAFSFVVDTSTKITAVLGAGASGNVSVTSLGGTASQSGFIYDNTPSITSIIPAIAGSGSVVSITGKHFNGVNSVTFGGIPAMSFTIISSFKITAVVGAGASGNIIVTNSAGSAVTAGFTFIPSPSISSFTPVAAGPLQIVTITGNNFNGASSVNFGDVPASSFIVNSNTSISAVVAGGSSGFVKIITTGGIDSLNGFGFISLPVPVINSFSPATGPIGTHVTITGINFSSVISNNIVYFGAVKAIITSATNTQLKVIVPPGATYQPITVTSFELTAYSSQFFNVIFAGAKTDFNTSTFASKVNFATGSLPDEVKIGDLDGDGKPDLVAANYNSSSISVIKNISTRGIILFEDKKDYGLPGKPGHTLFIGDLDGDGKPDIAVPDESDFVSIFRNTSVNGIISFAAKIDFATGDTPEGIALGDINGDGKPDLVIANLHSHIVSVFRNRGAKGTILFDQRVDFITGESPYYVCIHDFDNDQKPDIAIANFYSNSVSVLKNTSSNAIISFDNKIDFAVGTQPYRLAIGDMDGDGKMDIAACNINAASISLLKNTSVSNTISFAVKTDFATDLSPYGVSVSDIDGDGMPDLASANYSYGTVSLLRNKGTANMLSFAPYTDTTNDNGPYSISSGDLDGDGKPELVTPNFGSNSVSVFRNKSGEINSGTLCPPSGNTSFTSNISGLTYQWQIGIDNGFYNLYDNNFFAGSIDRTLLLNDVQSGLNGWKFRCVVDGNYSDIFELQFVDTWMGTIDNLWENPFNWSCGIIPDNNTDVIINSGSIIVNSNVTIKSLHVNPGASVMVSTGYTLTLSH